MVNLSSLIHVINDFQAWGEIPDEEFELCTDSRKVNERSFFIAIKGQKHDAFDYVQDVIECGCRLILFELDDIKRERVETIWKKNKKICLVGVSDVTKAMQSLAKERSRLWQASGGHLIGLTGSNGKTTTKEMIFGILDLAFPGQVISTKGNLNNHWGVPMTLLTLRDDLKIMVLEMGTSAGGEIQTLCEIANPKSGLITNIGTGHIEFFKTQDRILVEKSALYHWICRRREGVFILNTDDPFLNRLERARPVVYPVEDGGKRVFSALEDQLIFHDDQDVVIKNENIYGVHLYHNLGLSLYLLRTIFKEEFSRFVEIAQAFRLPSNNRAEWIERDGKLYFLDAYNANPNSMRASLQSFASRLISKNIDPSTALLVLGDMNELGELAEDYHREIGGYVSSLGFTNAIFIGRFASHYCKGMDGGLSFADKESAIESFKEKVKSSSACFIKGSRSLQLESIIAIV